MSTQADSLYTVLGVERSATAKEIKEAFRKMSSKHHPDKEGGSPEMIVKVNGAYSVLSDPERKALYDFNGALIEPLSVDMEANQMLIQLFSQLLFADPGTFLNSVTASLGASISNATQARSQAQARMSLLKARMEAVSVKEGVTNLLHGLIIQQIEAMQNSIGQATRAIAVMELAKLKSADYVSTESQTIQHQHVFYTTNTSTWR